MECESSSDVFWRVLAPCRHDLHRFVCKALNYADEADDVFQDTVLRAWRYFSSYDPQQPFRTWIYSIAHNELKKHYRRSGERRERELPADQALGLAAGGLTPHELSLARELHRLALQLKPRWREVFLLHYQDDFNAVEIAAITGLSHANVRFILFRARGRLRALLGGDHEE